MFVAQDSTLGSDGMLDFIRSANTVTMMRPIPALVRERDGKAQYLLIGQNEWQQLPPNFVKETRISHVQKFTDAEPLIVVHLTIEPPKTDAESFFFKIFMSMVSGSAAISSNDGEKGHDDCSCHEKETGTLTRPVYRSCAGCSYCGPCEPGYCYRSCYCYGQQAWCCDRVCGNGCSC